mgnify:CR=1 FL=1
MTNEQITKRIEKLQEQIEKQFQNYKAFVTNTWAKAEIFEK